jgi:uncharacterized protein (DUF4415 family)
MSTKKSAEFDYRRHAKVSGPDTAKVRRGTQRRAKPIEPSKRRITIRIDQEILEEFRQLTPGGRGYQRLINHALREWLTARGIKELVRTELQGMVAEAVTKAAG